MVQSIQNFRPPSWFLAAIFDFAARNWLTSYIWPQKSIQWIEFHQNAPGCSQECIKTINQVNFGIAWFIFDRSYVEIVEIANFSIFYNELNFSHWLVQNVITYFVNPLDWKTAYKSHLSFDISFFILAPSKLLLRYFP